MLETIYNGSYLVASILIMVYIGFYFTKRENTNIRVALACTMAVIATSWIFDGSFNGYLQSTKRNWLYFVIWVLFIIVEFLDSKKNRRS